jgi:hypothetical protein
MKRNRDLPPITREMLETAQTAGQSQIDIIRATGLPQHRVWRACHKFGIKLVDKRGAKSGQPGARELRMRALYTNGHTLEQIGQIYGVTRERVRQLLTKHFNLRADGGGKSVVKKRRAEERRARKDAASLNRHGCTWAEYIAIRDHGKDEGRKCRRPTIAFASQKKNAHHRGIGWELNLAQWWSIWQASGKWNERGRGQGYVMCRKGDEGPYAVGNVFIATARENTSEGNRRDTTLPMGVRPTKGHAGFIAQRQIRGKKIYLGTFPTPELAHAAYLAADPSLAA